MENPAQRTQRTPALRQKLQRPIQQQCGQQQQGPPPPPPQQQQEDKKPHEPLLECSQDFKPNDQHDVSVGVPVQRVALVSVLGALDTPGKRQGVALLFQVRRTGGV